MNGAETHGARYFPAGRILLVHSPRPSVLQMHPYRVFPANAEAFRVLRVLSTVSGLKDVADRLGLRTPRDHASLYGFLESSVKSGLLTRDPREAGHVREKRPALSPPLERIFLEVTTGCNLRCAHCYMSATSDQSQVRQLTCEQVLSLVDRADALGVYRLDFTGGELLLHPHLRIFLQAARDANMISNIFTNGTLLDQEQCEFLAGLQSVRTAFVSLDDMDAAAHDAFRGVAGAFDRTVAGIRLLRDAGVRVVVNTTITPRNARRIPLIAGFIRDELGVECRTASIVYVGRGECLASDAVSTHDVVSAMRCVIGDRSHLLAGYCAEPSEGEYAIPSCGVGHRMLHIRADGEICLCPTLSARESGLFRLGQLGRDDIGEIWETSETLRGFRQSRCPRSDCPHLPVCRGGCRSRAFLNCGELDSPDALMCSYFGAADAL